MSAGLECARREWQPVELSRVFPPAIATVDAADLPGERALFAGERAFIAGAAKKRRRQFTAGRSCARTGMARFGVPAGPLFAGADGAPRWPRGIVGSIAHTDRHCGAAVGAGDAFLGVGLDIEWVRAVRVALWPHLLTAAELASVRERLPEDRQRYAATLFSAKESFYKCRRAAGGGWLGFQDVQVRIRESSRAFDVELRNAEPPTPVRGARLDGRFWYGPGVVVTGAVLAS